MNILQSIQQTVGNLWGEVKGSPRELPGIYTVPMAHSDQADLIAQALVKDNCYFQVRVNEMYLSYDRKWFSTYEPMLFTTTEFLYGGKPQAVPTIVGAQLMPKLPTGELPERMVFANTRVAGLHPYRGGRMTLTVILYRSERDNIAQGMLRLIESTASALDFTNAVDTYVKVAKAAIDGVQTLLGLGKLQPLLGIRREFDPDAQDALTPGYFVLCNRTDLDEARMWVKEGRLFYGDSLAGATQLTGDDYVLYSIMATDKRSDSDTLPFYTLYEKAKAQAAIATDESWSVAKANLASTHQMMVTSPDLTPAQIETLLDGYISEITGIRKTASKISSLAPKNQAEKQQTSQAFSILQLK